jgi:hypothetical protein
MIRRRKRKNDPTPKDLDIEMTSQSAGIWVNIKESLPPYFKVVTVKTKAGTKLEDCARIPDENTDCYIQGLGTIITDIVEWMIPEYPTKNISIGKK